MKYFILILTTMICFYSKSFSQVSPKPQSGLPNQNNQEIISSYQDSMIKLKLVKLALNNPAMKIADANIRISEAQLTRARNSWLSSINLSGNVNEFTIENSPVALYYPKYNFGVTLPLDIFSRVNSDKEFARQNIVINSELKKDKAEMLKVQVLVAYENYKEKKEIVFIERSYIEYDYSAYEAAQKSYSDGDIKVDVMNKAYQEYLIGKAKLVTFEKDLNIAVIELEQLVGVPLSEALKL
ncbi:MAG TPA: TolC family protein [Puia sp.]|nr:TolC family protein [Puia sp.]